MAKSNATSAAAPAATPADPLAEYGPAIAVRAAAPAKPARVTYAKASEVDWSKARLISVAPNPKKPGTDAHRYYEAYTPYIGQLISVALAAKAFRRDHILWDLPRGFIVLGE